MKWALILGALEGALSFAAKHRAAIVALGVVVLLLALAVAGIYLPEPHYRATPVAAGFLVSFFAGVLGCKVLDRPEAS